MSPIVRGNINQALHRGANGVNMSKITFDKMETFDGVGMAYMIVGCKNVGSISRERPTKLGVNFGVISDTSAPWMYTVEVNDVEIAIPDGTNLRTVKKLMVAAFNAANG